MEPIASDLGPVDWAAVAEAFGATGVRVESDAAFEPALRAALSSRRPTVLHLVVDRRWVSVDRVDDSLSAVEPPAEPPLSEEVTEPAPDELGPRESAADAVEAAELPLVEDGSPIEDVAPAPDVAPAAEESPPEAATADVLASAGPDAPAPDGAPPEALPEAPVEG
jgi:hypothetical protein